MSFEDHAHPTSTAFSLLFLGYSHTPTSWQSQAFQVLFKILIQENSMIVASMDIFHSLPMVLAIIVFNLDFFI